MLRTANKVSPNVTALETSKSGGQAVGLCTPVASYSMLIFTLLLSLNCINCLQ